ncbi:MAG: GNAT family N-acetyltransferase [Ktedonobacteraceae bacterium]|nr:GNAT family N-acetyltransferase [Ktedonobacteraceae bacterium]
MADVNFITDETVRLRLRPFIESDLPAFITYRNDPMVARYQSWEGISQEEAEAFLREQQSIQPDIPGQGMQIAIEYKETGALIGDCYFIINEHDRHQAEIGYTLARAYQGRGFATEAISCLLTYVFTRFHLHRIIAITDCENAASVALLERIGMRREGHFHQNIWFKGKWGDEYLYAILREEWFKRNVFSLS